MLTLTMGVPGSGKSTWAAAEQQRTGCTLVTLDAVRFDRSTLSPIDAAERAAQKALARGHPVLVDACSTQPARRIRWLHLAGTAPTRLVVIHCPPELATTRNRSRTVGQVPAHRMASYLADFDRALEDIRSEPWGEVVHVHPAPAPRTAW